MSINTPHEGQNLRKIIFDRYDDLQKAADDLDYSYTYLSDCFSETQLNPKFKRRISKALGIPVSLMETGEQPPPPPVQAESDWKELAMYYKEKFDEWQAKYLALLEKINQSPK